MAYFVLICAVKKLLTHSLTLCCCQAMELMHQLMTSEVELVMNVKGLSHPLYVVQDVSHSVTRNLETKPTSCKCCFSPVKNYHASVS